MRRTIQELYDVRRRQKEEDHQPAQVVTTTVTTTHPDGRIEVHTIQTPVGKEVPTQTPSRCVFHPRRCADIRGASSEWCAFCVESARFIPCNVPCYEPPVCTPVCRRPGAANS